MVGGPKIICFRIISNVGGARSGYVEAIQKAEQDDFEDARGCIRVGQEMFLAGHEAHFELIQKKVQREQVGGSMILVRAEDQLMSAEGFKIITEKMLAGYERTTELEKKLENR